MGWWKKLKINKRFASEWAASFKHLRQFDQRDTRISWLNLGNRETENVMRWGRAWDRLEKLRLFPCRRNQWATISAEALREGLIGEWCTNRRLTHFKKASWIWLRLAMGKGTAGRCNEGTSFIFDCFCKTFNVNGFMLATSRNKSLLQILEAFLIPKFMRHLNSTVQRHTVRVKHNNCSAFDYIRPKTSTEISATTRDCCTTRWALLPHCYVM